MKSKPNLFRFATSELSQDAFICWLASWADASLRLENESLHATAITFLTRLLEIGMGPQIAEITSVEVHRQWSNIDVLLMVNGNTAIIIEDKTDTKDHSDQLARYKSAVVAKFPTHKIVAIYLKTGDQSNYRSVVQAGYGQFLRQDFLDILAWGESVGVANDIFLDFHKHLRSIETAVQSFSTVCLNEWGKDWNRWTGFFLVLQQRLSDGDWNYVANPSGGFMGYWWHRINDCYLQIENERLCFKIEVPQPAEQKAKWLEWNKALLSENGLGGLSIKKSIQRTGRWMTVAILEGDYRHPDGEGRLDLDCTVETLKKAEALMDAAMLRFST